jgi:hypothetical protein
VASTSHLQQHIDGPHTGGTTTAKNTDGTSIRVDHFSPKPADGIRPCRLKTSSIVLEPIGLT